jgi:uncharacterized membrane protein YkoI
MRPRWHRRLEAAATATALLLATVAGFDLPATAAHALNGHGHTSTHLRVRDRAALVLARALRASLAARGMTVLSMRPAREGGVAGYLVTWLRGSTEGHVFVDAKNGRVRPVGRRLHLKASSMSTQVQQGTPLATFLAALENTLAAQAGAPVTAQSEDNGAITVFSLNVGGQTITITVNTQAGTAQGGSATSSTPTPTIQAPAVSMQDAVTAALGTVTSLAIPSLASPYAVAATLYGWPAIQGGMASGDQSNQGDQGDQGDQGYGFGNSLFAGVPAYAVVVASAAGGRASVLESAQGATSGAGGAAAPQLLGIDTLHGDFQGSGQGAFVQPQTSLVAAVAAAVAADPGAIPLAAMFGSDGNAVWQVTLLNADGSTSQLIVDDATGQVVSGAGATSGQGAGSDQGGGSSSSDNGSGNGSGNGNSDN